MKIQLMFICAGLILIGCKKDETISNQYVERAQIVVNNILNGSACTTLRKERYTIATGDEYHKIAILEKYGFVTVEKMKASSGIDVWRVHSVKEPRYGRIIENGRHRYFVVGKRKVISAEPTTKLSKKDGQIPLLIHTRLVESPDWLEKNDAKILAKASFTGDPCFFRHIDEDNIVKPASFYKVNTSFVYASD